MKRPSLSVLLPLLVPALAGCGSPSSAPPTPPSNLAAGGGSSAQNHVHSILIMPGKPNELLLGAHFHLSRSTDGGRNWTILNKQMMLSMALDPHLANTIYGVSLQRGLEKSTNGGTTWKGIATGIPTGHVTGIVADPSGAYLLAYGAGAYRSTDGGAHWTHVLKGHSVAGAATGSAGTAYIAAGDGLLVSHDGGATWRTVASIGNQPVIQVAATGNAAYAVTAIGVERSLNAGRTWSLLSKVPVGVEFLGVAPGDANEVLAEVGGKGFFVSHDAGKSWTHAAGIHDTNFNASTVRVAPTAPSIAYTGAWGVHLYATHDGGLHWTQVAYLKK
jgi:hypothetical protein